MIILGISFLSDASAYLLVDGKIIAAISEERINRKKLWDGIPRRSIEKVLEISRLYNLPLNLPDHYQSTISFI